MYSQICFFLLSCLLQLSASDRTDIVVSTGTLVSRDGSAGCTEHRSIVCESNAVPSLTPSVYNRGRFRPGPLLPSDVCSSTACWDPPPLKYQLLHETDDTSWSLIVKWETPPATVNCSLLEYHHVMVVRLETYNNLTCGDMSSSPQTWYFGPFNNTVNHIYFNEDFNIVGQQHQYHIKVISSNIEYPLLVVRTPNECNQQYFTGCQNCQDNPCTPDLSPATINVSVTDSLSSDGLQVLVSIAESYAQEYFLHTLSSGRKLLHKLSQDTRYVYLSNVPYNNETLIWVEKFSCGCSNSSLIYRINGTNYTSIISPYSSIPSAAPQSTHTPTPSLPSTDTQPAMTSINSNIVSINSNTVSINSNTVSINSNIVSINSNTVSINSNTVSINSNVSSTSTVVIETSATPSSAPSANRNNILIIILPVSLVILAVGLVLLTVIGFILHRRRNKCVDTVCSDVPPVLDSPDTAINMMKCFHPSSASTSVISVIPHDTPSDDKEAYLVFLNELVPHGASLEVYCRSQRVSPADWLQSVFKRDSIVLLIINEEFYDEWSGQSVSDVPMVFALKQLVHSLVQQSLELKNFLIILPNPSDKKYIPDYYLFHTLQRFDLQDTEGIARYIFKVPEFTVDSTC